MTSNLKELVHFGLKAMELVDRLADGFQLSDLGKILDVAKSAPPAIKDAGAALAEYKAMSDAEALDLEAYIATDFDISNDAIEGVIEQALDILIKLHSLAAKVLKKPV